MVNLKTKFDKHANDNEKRRKAIKEREKAKWSQSQIIKQSLSNSILSNNSSKKIIFSEDDQNGIEDAKRNGKNLDGIGKSVLFDDSGSEPEDFEIREKSQFSGEKGFELLNLQSTYGNDERFKIDERFLEVGKQEFKEGDTKTPDDAHAAGEKVKQLKILESILGTPVVSFQREKKAKKRATEMVRYDASNKDHEIYEIHNQSKTEKSTPGKKRKEGRRTLRIDKQDIPIPKVSKEKFYEVSNEIKNRFKEKTEESGQFSLLQTYGLNGADKDKDVEEKEEVEEDAVGFAEYIEEDDKNYERDIKCRVDDKMVTEEPKEEKKDVLAKGIWKESFFFVQDDPRFKEGLEFINKKNSEEAQEAAENYDKTRKKLKEILRLHLKKQMHKKDPFRNKVGGMNKKQLAGYKSKNSRTTFNKRKPPKMNPGGRF